MSWPAWSIADTRKTHDKMRLRKLLLIALLPLAGCTDAVPIQEVDGKYIVATAQQSPWESSDSLKKRNLSKAQEHCNGMGLNPQVLSFENYTAGDPLTPLSSIRAKFICK